MLVKFNKTVKAEDGVNCLKGCKICFSKAKSNKKEKEKRKCRG